MITLCSVNSATFQDTWMGSRCHSVCFCDMNNWRKFLAADQDGRDWAGITEVRAAVRQVLIPCPARWSQPGWTYSLSAASTRGQGGYEQSEVRREDIMCPLVILFDNYSNCRYVISFSSTKVLHDLNQQTLLKPLLATHSISLCVGQWVALRI